MCFKTRALIKYLNIVLLRHIIGRCVLCNICYTVIKHQYQCIGSMHNKFLKVFNVNQKDRKKSLSAHNWITLIRINLFNLYSIQCYFTFDNFIQCLSMSLIRFRLVVLAITIVIGNSFMVGRKMFIAGKFSNSVTTI
jgi:hypothetical protein